MKKLNQVLIVDDDEVNNLFSKIVIEHSGISGEVHYCLSGPEAFDYLSSCLNSGSAVPDLILLDIDMPRMDGFDFLDLYHEFGYHKLLPTKISMLTASPIESDKRNALNYKGVIDYVLKPLSEGALSNLLHKIHTPPYH